MTETDPQSQHGAEYAPLNRDEELCFQTVGELEAALDRGDFTSEELTLLHLQRIDRLNPQINAYVTVLAEQALESAKRSDDRRRAGEKSGSLDGIPVSVKDVEPMAGVRFTMGGLVPMSDHVSNLDPDHVKALRDGGAVILGKTNGPELGHKGTTDNLLFGPTKAPFDLRYNAGGSSGGAAAAVVAGLAVVSQGSDGGGSLRIPAAMTGSVGYKASSLRVPEVRRPNAFQALSPFQTIGMIGRTVADTRTATNLLARHVSRDPFSWPFPVVAETQSSVRIGFDPRFGNFPIANDVAVATAEQMTKLSRSLHVEDLHVGLPDYAELAELWVRLISVQTAVLAEDFRAFGVDLRGKDRDSIPPELAREIEIGDRMSAVDNSRDQEFRTRVLDAIEDAFEVVDIIATPTLCVAGVRNGERGRTVGPSDVEGMPTETTIGWTLTFPVNFSGHPAISIPIATTADGLPIGLQLVGRRGSDELLLHTAESIARLLAA
ncbi:MAG: Aspartyl-tRNA(Asn)/glutamyl-tRNA(Gln) amidotransferase subunit [Glaciihabitans sp.]|nr:Aspartyl-tRNA(Asn)/glutamyl-tRNA(Gln) amidotransferase subunit [Glaciihabitans sp.]